MITAAHRRRACTTGRSLIEGLEPRRLLAAATLLLDAEPGPASSVPFYCGQHDGRAVFATGRADGAATDVWTSDGTAAGTTLVGTFPTRVHTRDVVLDDGKVYVRATNPRGFGSPIAWMDLSNGEVTKRPWTFTASGYFPGSLRLHDGVVCFTLFYRGPGYFDTGLFGVHDDYRQGTVGESEGFTVRGRGLRLDSTGAGSSQELNLSQAWQTPLVPASQLLKDDVPSQRLIDLGGLALFAANLTEVWTSDGTRDGTRKLARVEELAPVDAREATLLGHVNGRLLYAHATPEHGTEVWAQDAALDLPQLTVPPAPALAPGMDTGASANDGITSNHRPTFVGLAPPGSTVTLFANGAQAGAVVARADGRYEITPLISLLRFPDNQAAVDGVGRMRIRVNVTGSDGRVSDGSPPLDLKLDVRGPIPHEFNRPDTSSTRIDFVLRDAYGFDLDTIAAEDVVLHNLTTGETIEPSAMHLASSVSGSFRPELGVTVTFPGLPGEALPPGEYRLTLEPGAMRDLAGNGLSSASGMTGPALAHEFTIDARLAGRGIMYGYSPVGAFARVDATDRGETDLLDLGS